MLFTDIDNLIKEWCFWLSYINKDEKENIKRIGAKKASKVTKKERKILDCYQEELELLKVLKKYPKKRWNDADYRLIDKYLTNSIEKLILQKLSDSERLFRGQKKELRTVLNLQVIRQNQLLGMLNFDYYKDNIELVCKI